MLAESFKKIEAKLYRYYDNLRKLDMLRAQLETVEKEISEVRSLNANNYELCSSFGMTAQYITERVQGRKSIYHSPIEDAYFSITDTTGKLISRRVRIKMRIIKLEEKMDGIRFTLSQLSPFEQKIVEYKYRENMSTRQIARMMNMDRSSIERTREKIVEQIGRLLEASNV